MSRAPAYAALAAAGMAWGTAFFLGKLAFAQLSVEHLLFYRFIFGVAGLMPILLRPAGRAAVAACLADLPTFIGAALTGVPLLYLIQYYGLHLTTVSHASLMMGVVPVLFAVAGTVFHRERLTRGVWIAVTASTLGAALIVVGAGRSTDPHGPSLAGDLLVVLSTVAGVAWALLSKRLMASRGGQSPAGVSAAVVAAGSIPLLGWVWLHSGPPPVHLSMTTWAAVIAQGLLCTAAATVWWNWGLSHVSPSVAGVFVNLDPLTGTTLGVLIFHEVLSMPAIAGGLLIIGATLFVSLYRPASARGRRGAGGPVLAPE